MQVGPAGTYVDSGAELFGSSSVAETHAAREDLGEGVESDDLAWRRDDKGFKLKVRGDKLGGQEVVWVV